MGDWVTYSKNVFIPVTNLCRNRCGYCGFRRELNEAVLIARDQAARILDAGAKNGCSEALITMGDRPWEVSGSERVLGSSSAGTFLNYLIELCEMSLDRGLLPHTNAGILNEDEMKLLAPYNASMGLMLETTSNVKLHEGSIGKSPDVRLNQIAAAGKLRIPFTTGILVGIGESFEDRKTSLESIARLSKRYGHVQEVIIQGLDPKTKTPSAEMKPPSIDELKSTVALARSILPSDVSIQVPPNLTDPWPLVMAGADDLGGISPVTPDWINPLKKWPSIADLKRNGRLKERLAVYPRYVKAKWYGSYTRDIVESLADRQGFRRILSEEISSS